MTSSNGNIFRVTGHLCGESVNSPHTGHWRGALMFSLICAWINGSVNNREAGALRRQRAHHDVIVMVTQNIRDKIMRWDTLVTMNLWNFISMLIKGTIDSLCRWTIFLINTSSHRLINVRTLCLLVWQMWQRSKRSIRLFSKHKRHPLARPWGPIKGRILRFQNNFLLLPHYMWCFVILDTIETSVYCNIYNIISAHIGYRLVGNLYIISPLQPWQPSAAISQQLYGK